MPDSFVAIVGSADTTRQSGYNPPLKHADLIPKAAEELGRALADAGFGIIVYSAGPQFIEGDVVRGYVESGHATAESIQIRYPQGVANTDQQFYKADTNDQLFKPLPDNYGYWQVSFYMSLQEAQGILLMGGAESAFITGLVAKINNIPCLALATFGGSAESVWGVALGGLATAEHRALMARGTWGADSAKRLVSALSEECRARAVEETNRRLAKEMTSRKLRQRAWLAGVAFLGAAALTGLGMFGKFTHVWPFALAFFGTPVLAGLCGGIARLVSDDYRGEAPPTENAAVQGAVLGMIAGVVSAILFVLAQIASNTTVVDFSNGVPSGLGKLVPFELIVAFTGGFTLEAVFAKLRRTDVVNTTSVAMTDKSG